MSDWLSIYNHYRKSEGSDAVARQIVAGLIMKDHFLNEQSAHAYLDNILNVASKNWLKVYKYHRTLQGSVINARNIVVGLIMESENLRKEDAQDLLTDLINKEVEAEIAAQNQEFLEIRRRAG